MSVGVIRDISILHTVTVQQPDSDEPGELAYVADDAFKVIPARWYADRGSQEGLDWPFINGKLVLALPMKDLAKKLKRENEIWNNLFFQQAEYSKEEVAQALSLPFHLLNAGDKKGLHFRNVIEEVFRKLDLGVIVPLEQIFVGIDLQEIRNQATITETKRVD